MKSTMEEMVRSISFISDLLPVIVLSVFLLGGTIILWLLGRSILYLFKKRWRRSERGGVAVEHALLLILIAAVIVGVLGLFGERLKSLFDLAATLFRVP